MYIILVVFLLVYVAMGFGRLPGFKVDRTGAATLGAMALLSLGSISPAAAWQSIDYRAIGLLFGLMVVSSAFVAAGFYEAAAHRVGKLKASPPALLAIFIAVAGALSAALTNDVVVVAMTPALVAITLARGLNPLPFMLGFCFAANVGSAATLIGSPQNMIAAEALHLSFTGFMRAAALPAIIALPIVWAVVAFAYRGNWTLAPAPAPAASAGGASSTSAPFNRLETVKAGLVTLAVVAAFVCSSWPHMLIAMAGASVLLLNRRIASADMMRHVDGDLLLLLMGLFVVNAALASTGLPGNVLESLKGIGLDLTEPLSLLVVMSVLSNVVGNNPAVMLVAPFIQGAPQSDALGAAIALGTGFSSNMVIFGSLAGIIIAEQGRANSVSVGFWAFTRVGLPIALLALALAAAWIGWLRG
ncbi:SLC13 family permease [Methylocella sp.]|uniref:SLC13 family permease n=1 Tax=Methylocella sp. TaxID=1978226 RepID=UPI0037840ACD